MNHHTTSRNILSIVQAAMIAALYIVLTGLAAGFDLASGAIQVRFSEVLTILPFFTPAAIPGVTIGCLLANILTGSALPDSEPMRSESIAFSARSAQSSRTASSSRWFSAMPTRSLVHSGSWH